MFISVPHTIYDVFRNFKPTKISILGDLGVRERQNEPLSNSPTPQGYTL